MTEKKPKGPSLSALAALATLAVALWLEVDLATALFRSVLVYLALSMLSMVYRVVLGGFIAASQRRAQEELLRKVQREAEEEQRRTPKGAQVSRNGGVQQKEREKVSGPKGVKAAEEAYAEAEKEDLAERLSQEEPVGTR